MLLGGGALLVAVVLFTFVHLLAKPEMTVLYSNMEQADAQSLGERLTLKNIRYQLSPDGKSVLVPADQLDTARLEIASQGVPHSGRLGFELFDKTNWATSDFDDKVNYQRALEGELERTIQAHERRRSRTRASCHSARFHLLRTGSPGQGWSNPKAPGSSSLGRHAAGRAAPGLQRG